MKSKLFHSLKCNSFVFLYKKQISANTNVKKIHYSSEIGYDIGDFLLSSWSFSLPYRNLSCCADYCTNFSCILLLHLIKIMDTFGRQIMGNHSKSVGMGIQEYVSLLGTD